MNRKKIAILAACIVAVVAFLCLIAIVPAQSSLENLNSSIQQQNEQNDQQRQETDRAKSEFASLLERAESIEEGTADPPASEERDGALCSLVLDQEKNPSVVRVEASPVELFEAHYDSDSEAQLTVSYTSVGYDEDGNRVFHDMHRLDTWYAKKGSDGWIIYRMETSEQDPFENGYTELPSRVQ
ncbi:MAG: hypothetical protein ACOYIK_09745 [Coriobacteriales bacterium]|jgi:hypothetical protein